MVAKSDLMMTKKVVVLIPPPVEPGEAPMKIMMMKMSREGTVMASISTMLKPAVRPHVIWNKAEKNFSNPLLFAKVLLYSNV